MQAPRVYVGTIGEGLWRSLDGGSTFSRKIDGMFVECHVRALAVHPQDDRTLFLGNEHGLWVSHDGADNWKPIDSPFQEMQIWSILIDPKNPKRMLVGTCPSSFFVTENEGGTWTEGKADIVKTCPRIIHTRVTTLREDPNNADTFWAGVEIDGLHRSTDAGITWTRVPGPGLISQDIHDIRFLQDGNQSILLAATNADLHRSTDGGNSWKALDVKKTMPWPYCRSLMVPLGQTKVALLGNGSAPPGFAGVVGRSDNFGLTWKPAILPAIANSTFWNFAVHPSNPRLIYANTVSGQLYRSQDQGESWEKFPIEFGEIRALAWTP